MNMDRAGAAALVIGSIAYIALMAVHPNHVGPGWSFSRSAWCTHACSQPVGVRLRHAHGDWADRTLPVRVQFLILGAVLGCSGTMTASHPKYPGRARHSAKPWWGPIDTEARASGGIGATHGWRTALSPRALRDVRRLTVEPRVDPRSWMVIVRVMGWRGNCVWLGNCPGLANSNPTGRCGPLAHALDMMADSLLFSQRGIK